MGDSPDREAPSPGAAERRRLGFVLGALLVAVLGELAVLVLVSAPLARAVGGMALAAVIVWLAMGLGAARVLQARRASGPIRRFDALRATVEEFLAEIRRLNWVAVIGERGFRDPETAERERGVIERRLHQLVDEIRDAAGRESAGGTRANDA